jgi:peptidoglycan/xylan/chitin deacetylase (PgdA/CDA1 family)
MMTFRKVRQSLLTSFFLLPIFRKTRQRVAEQHVTILLYHQITPARFIDHLRFLETRFNIVRLRQLKLVREGKAELPPKSLVITFDDGWRSNYELLSCLEKTGHPVTLFLTAGLIDTHGALWNHIPSLTNASENNRLKRIANNEREAYLSNNHDHEPTSEYAERTLLNKQEIGELTPYVDFQSHGMFHPVLTRCSDSELMFELTESKRRLEALLDSEIYAFAYPYGRAGTREIAAARQAGYSLARKASNYGVNRPDADLYSLKSIGIGEHFTARDLDRRIAWGQLRTWLNWN